MSVIAVTELNKSCVVPGDRVWGGRDDLVSRAGGREDERGRDGGMDAGG